MNNFYRNLFTIYGIKENILLRVEGLDTLDGNGCEDISIFSGNIEDYDSSISQEQKTITFNHAIRN